ncbi:homoserine kinase [Neobacillus muris]|uniref:homoserine kinase n=1 Tax=Neobacillus muris TaxID=2941334 RepID=UPI00203C6F67|nr:homoserine kinase [Neobacillus muris]
MPLNNRFIIKVPASTANLGPGFDSVGLAVDLFLTLEVEQSSHWAFSALNDELQEFPADEKHFIGQVAISTAKRYGKVLPPCKVAIDSEIPLARGLGSSASAIIAGIELADAIGRLELSKQEKLQLATEWEGHPDNVGASLLGGLVIGCYQQNEVDMLSFANLNFDLAVVIPNEVLFTKDAREVLPKSFSREEAVQASAAGNLLVAALLSQDWETAGKMMSSDLFHQPYRKPLIRNYQEIEKAAKDNGAFGAALSGAGPTIICFTEKGNGKQLAQSLQKEFPDMMVKHLNIAPHGSCVKIDSIVG